MLIRDFLNISNNEAVHGDICIVGSGPAGATLVRELASSGLRIILLESGGSSRQIRADALNEIENIGSPRIIDQSLVRSRIIGGTSNIWTGRCAPFDDIDYEVRSWVPHSGWPIGPKEMTPFLDRTTNHLGLGIGSGFTDAGPVPRSNHAPRQSTVDEQLLRPFFWQFSRDAANRHDVMRFGQRMLVERADNIQHECDGSGSGVSGGGRSKR